MSIIPASRLILKNIDRGLSSGLGSLRQRDKHKILKSILRHLQVTHSLASGSFKTHQRKLVCFYFKKEEARRIRRSPSEEGRSEVVCDDSSPLLEVDAEMTEMSKLIHREDVVEFGRCFRLGMKLGSCEQTGEIVCVVAGFDDSGSHNAQDVLS